MLISGNIPFKTQVASVFIFKQIESDNPVGAAAVSVVLLVLSLLVLVRDPLARRAGGAGMSADRRTRIGLRVVALGYLALLLLIPVGVVFYRTFEHGIGAVLGRRSRRRRRIHAFWLTLVMVAIAVPLNTVFGVLAALALVRAARSAARRCSTR